MISARSKRHLQFFAIVSILYLTWVLLPSLNFNSLATSTRKRSQLETATPPSEVVGLRPHLDKVLGDRNATRLVLPRNNTIIIDGTEGFRVESWKYPGIPQMAQGKDVGRQADIFDKDKKLLLLIVINSQHEPGERVRRDVIRRTWGRWAGDLKIKVVFFLGIRAARLSSEVTRSLIDEINAHHDVIIDNMEEDYYRTSVKTLRMFKWFLGRFPKESNQRPTFLAKADPDCFINLPLVADRLRNVKNPEKFMGGGVAADLSVPRNSNHRHYMPWDFYGEEKWPEWMYGCLMFFSSKLIQPLFEGSMSEKLIPDDDIFISGIIRAKLGLKLTRMGGYRVLTTPKWYEIMKFGADSLLIHASGHHQYFPALFNRFGGMMMNRTNLTTPTTFINKKKMPKPIRN